LVLRWGHEILRILEAIHNTGIVHRDIKPENVMLRGEKMYIIDFGLSRLSPELEHFGLDLQVLRECLGSSHTKIHDAIEIVCEGYIDSESQNSDSARAIDVIERFHKIIGRVRYHG
ncbi:MAG: phosphotransferase, partial [Candidatus Thermoplasmatota archaeon]|nr:phosphotransferase [Candidatus Thermoplasmatota archaeon]MEC7425878.1 phosphotransferase [Candidatus Thermoplasmatota archaeon]